MRQGRLEKIASRASARRFPARRAAARAFAQLAKDSPVPPAICSACRSSSSLLLVPAGQATLLLFPTGGGRRHCSPPPVELVGCRRCSSSTRAAPGIQTGDGARCSSLPATGHPRMSMSEAATAHETETEGVNLLKRNSDDVGWEYGVLVDANNKEKVKCKFCDKEMRGGIYRLKEHLAHVGKNVKKCTARTPQALEAKEKCKKALEDATRKREEKTVRELELREEVNVSRVGESDEVTCVGSSQPHKLGPIDKWTRAIDPKATNADSLKQQQLNKELWKERVHEVHKFIARWAYNHAIPFNACDNDEFKQMCEAIGQFGPGLVPPSQDALQGSLLEEEYARTKSLLQEREAEKMKNGCSIMTDAWSDRKRRSIMNICTNCADGTSFISSNM